MIPRLGCGVAALGGAAVFGLAYIGLALLAVFGNAEQLDVAIAMGSLAYLAAFVGGMLVGSAARAGEVRPQRVFGPARPLFWLALLGAALVAGSAVLAVGLPGLTLLLFPALHVMAALAPALAVAAYFAWRAGAPAWLTWAGVIRQLLWGGVVATGIAFVLEAVAVVALVIAALLLLYLSADGRAAIEAASAVLSRCAAATPPPAGCEADLEALARDLVLRPEVVGMVFLLLGVIGPLVEEAAKVAGVAWCRPARRGQAWAWGLVTGAGFGILEAVMFGTMALTAAGWAVLLLGRACTTVLHATLTALAGTGWFDAWVGRRWLAGGSKFGLAVATHGLWNCLALVVLLTTLAGGGDGAGPTPVPGDTLWLAALASLATFGVVMTFSLLFVAFLGLSARYGREERRPEPPTLP